MSAIVTTLFVLNAFLLVGVVLIQQPKTAGGLFAGTGQSLLGTSGKTFWTKFTTILAGSFMILCLLMSFMHRFDAGPSSVTDIMEKQQQPAAPVQSAVTTSNSTAANPPVTSAPPKQGLPATNPSASKSSNP